MRRDNKNDGKKEIRAKAERDIETTYGLKLFKAFVRAYDAGVMSEANDIREKAKSLYLYSVVSFINQYTDQ